MTTVEMVLRRMRKVAREIYNGETTDENYAVLEALHDCISFSDLDSDTAELVEAVLDGATSDGCVGVNAPDNDHNLGLEDRLPAGGWRR